jgi:RimJ/RimL family protein N-acetyltransferase
MEQGGRYGWALTPSGSDRLIGMVEIRIQPPRAELGYVLGTRYWGQGYMVEAVGPIVEWALGQGAIHRVWAFCDADNGGSARVLEKVGMTREGTLRRWAMSPNLSDAPRDCHCYSIVRG